MVNCLLKKMIRGNNNVINVRTLKNKWKANQETELIYLKISTNIYDCIQNEKYM